MRSKLGTMVLAACLALLGGLASAATTVATCPTATAGAPWAKGAWLPCSAVVYATVPVSPSALVADLSAGVFSWTLASAVQATDSVWALPANSWVSAVAPNFPTPTASSTPPTAVGTGTAKVSWVPPTARADGTALNDLVSYNLLMGTSAAALSQVVNIPAPAASYVFQGLLPGTYWFAVQSVSTAGGTSVNSGEPSLTIAKSSTVAAPNAPTSVTVTATVTVP